MPKNLKNDRRFEAHEEFIRFGEAVKKPQPAIETLSNQALMLIFLCLGDKALRRLK